MSTKLNVRLAVGSHDGPRSSIWRIASHGNDVYVASGNNKSSKLSFHSSGICRDAFRREYGTPVTMADRLMYQWVRAPVPDPGSGRACLLLRIWIATDFLSTALAIPTKQVRWLSPAPMGGGRIIELFLSNDTEQHLVHEMAEHRELVVLAHLPCGIGVAVTTRVVDGSQEGFSVPSSHHQSKNLMISARDPDNSGRPVRFFVGNNPKDGDCKEIWEFGGYYLDGPLPAGIATFRRAKVFATQDTPTIEPRRR